MLSEIEKYAKDNRVPIMLSDGIEYLCKIIKENNVKNILEIGSAIGYSAIKMALVSDDINVTTIEKDENRYNQYKAWFYLISIQIRQHSFVGAHE